MQGMDLTKFLFFNPENPFIPADRIEVVHE